MVTASPQNPDTLGLSASLRNPGQTVDLRDGAAYMLTVSLWTSRTEGNLFLPGLGARNSEYRIFSCRVMARAGG